MASTLCTRMRLLVTVDNYNHTHEHLFEFGVQHAEIANFTIQRLRNPAVSDGGHGRRVMIVAPTLGVRNLHLVAEHIPDHAWLLPRVQRLDHGHIRQFGHPLITRQRTTVVRPNTSSSNSQNSRSRIHASVPPTAGQQKPASPQAIRVHS